MKFNVFSAIILSLILIALGLIWNSNLNSNFIFLPIIIWLIFVSIASSKIQWNFFLTAIHSGKTSEPKIALTFDDGPHPVYTPQVLDFLKQNKIKASFFCIGKNVKDFPHLVKRILDEGHTIGNHSFTHSKTIDFKNKKSWIEEIEKTDLEIEKIGGMKPQFFRPPYGVTTPHLASALKRTQHLVIGWNVRSFDTSSKNPSKTVRKICKKIRPGSIVLLHDRHENILPILEQLLPKIRDKNFTFVTVNELIHGEPFHQI